MVMRVFIEGIGVLGPGLEGWPEARAILAAITHYEPRPFRPPPPTLLPPAERRRAGTTVKLAIAVGTEALAHAQRDPAEMAMVFAASGGDGETVHETLSVLATAQREVSPTRFHNSVHNAPSGYWSVATGSRAPSTSLSAFDDSFATGMLEAAVQATMQNCPITLIAYDVPYPEPLHAARPIISAFAMALVLAPHRSERGLASLTLAITDAAAPATGMTDLELERLRLGNPAARALPLLAAVARGDAGTVRLGSLDIEVAPS
jgi:Beta-ketoacyl synthase, N-terminal domain